MLFYINAFFYINVISYKVKTYQVACSAPLYQIFLDRTLYIYITNKNIFGGGGGRGGRGGEGGGGGGGEGAVINSFVSALAI